MKTIIMMIFSVVGSAVFSFVFGRSTDVLYYICRQRCCMLFLTLRIAACQIFKVKSQPPLEFAITRGPPFIFYVFCLLPPKNLEKIKILLYKVYIYFNNTYFMIYMYFLFHIDLNVRLYIMRTTSSFL